MEISRSLYFSVLMILKKTISYTRSESIRNLHILSDFSAAIVEHVTFACWKSLEVFGNGAAVGRLPFFRDQPVPQQPLQIQTRRVRQNRRGLLRVGTGTLPRRQMPLEGTFSSVNTLSNIAEN